MKALTFQGLKTIQYCSVPDPIIEQEYDVVVKVTHCAICGSDLHVYHEREQGCDHGTIMGHEFTGEVVELGKSIKTLQVGDKVVSAFSTSCGQCYQCRRGLTARCIHNQLYGFRTNQQGLQGAQAEYIRVPYADATLVPYEPFGIESAAALLAGDILSTGYFGALQAEISGGETIVVIGCGPVGLMAIFSALQLGAERVVAIDGITERLALASKYGAHTIDFNKPEHHLELDHLIGPQGAHAIIEAVGSPIAQSMAYNLVQEGGIISTIGVHTTEPFAITPAQLYNKNLTYKTGRCPARTMMNHTLPLLTTHHKLLTQVYTHNIQLADGPQAYKIFDQKQEGCIKVLISNS